MEAALASIVTPAILALGLLVFLREVRPWHLFAARLLLLHPDCCFWSFGHGHEEQGAAKHGTDRRTDEGSDF